MDDERLTPRQTELLRALCREYLLSGQDVGSAGLARHAGWSSATIRNELVALEREGLVERSHRSAGSRPTRLGLEHYLRALPREVEPNSAHARVVDRSLLPTTAAPHGMRAAVRVLSELGGCVAVGFIADPGARRVQALELVPLSSTRVLVALGFDDGASIVQPVGLGAHRSQAMSAAAAREVPQRLRRLCGGRTLAPALDALLALQRELESHVDARLAEFVRVGLSVCAGAGLDPLWLAVAGQASLAIDLAADAAGTPTQPHRAAAARERLAELLARLEDERRLAEILWQLLPAAGAAGQPHAQVRLGGVTLLDPDASRTADDADLRLALVGCRLPTPDAGGAHPSAARGRMGAVAVLGPDRMDYAAVIPLIEYAARALAVRP